jgi:hypothetical protein
MLMLLVISLVIAVSLAVYFVFRLFAGSGTEAGNESRADRRLSSVHHKT